ncbi:hypothetical protein D3C78_1517070 [compost metagenome]
MVASTSSPPGAEISTFLAPALMCAWHFSLLVKAPVHSSTRSTCSASHGSSAGLRVEKNGMRSPLTISVFSSWLTSAAKRPCTVSNLVRCALVARSPEALTATISKSLRRLYS